MRIEVVDFDANVRANFPAVSAGDTLFRADRLAGAASPLIGFRISFQYL
jgi:hypothetical protein